MHLLGEYLEIDVKNIGAEEGMKVGGSMGGIGCPLKDSSAFRVLG